MSIAELRIGHQARSGAWPGGWSGSNARQANKRTSWFWPFGESTAHAGQARSGKAAKGTKSIGLFLRLVRFAAWAVGLLLALFVLGMLSLGLVHGYRTLTASEHFAVSSVEISGNSQLSNAEILSLSGITGEESILEVSLREINSRLLADPWVESVTVRRILPGKVSIHVREKEPFFWIQQAGILHYADRLGNPIAPVELGRFVSLPALIIEEGVSADWGGLQEWMLAVERMEYPFGFSDVAWLKLEEADIVRLYLEDHDLDIVMDFGAWQEHGRILNRVWEDLRIRGELERVGRITVKSGKAWVQAKASR
jgi:cell division protein FtsQ